jgi:hypothetical protein
MNFGFVIKIAASYLEKHPEVVEQLVESLVQALLSHLKGPAAPGGSVTA